MSIPKAIVRGIGPREGFPDYVVKKYGSDRHGVYSGMVQRNWKIGDANQRINPAWASILNAPDPGWGIPCIGVSGDVRDGQYIADYNYEGIAGSFAPTDDQKTFEMDGTMGDRRIELHPRFEELKKLFGWDPDLRTFQEFLPAAADALKTGGKVGALSPLRGVDSWFYIGLTYRISYATQQFPALILRQIGTLIKSPPNINKFRLPRASANRRWLVMAPRLSLRGNCAQVSEEYLLGEPGGYPEAIYSFAQLGT